MKKQKVSILGCGWVGLPLAQCLSLRGFKILGSTTSPEKLATLETFGIVPYLIYFDAKTDAKLLDEFLTSDILIIAIPPGRKDNERNDNYRQMLRQLIINLPKSTIKKILFISSTSVYRDDNKLINENTQAHPETASARLLAQAEQEFMKLENKEIVVLRLSGLIGPGRHPARFFAGKTNIINGLAPVNLIHLEDVIQAITLLIEAKNATGIYNACAPSHPTRQEFYTLAAKQAGLEMPQFIAEKKSWKIVNCTRLSELGFSFKVADLMEWLIFDTKN